MLEITELLGKTLTKIVGCVGEDELIFYANDGTSYKMYHEQDCCESVDIDDINGDLDDLIGTPILLAEEACSYDGDEVTANLNSYNCESFTWTFYKLATVKGYVDIRWFGTSNGYYSESVDFIQLS